MGRQMPKTGVIPTPEEYQALFEWVQEWEQMQREAARRSAQGNPPASSSSPPKQQNIAPYMLDTWGKSLQALFANKGVGDILSRFTVDHLANLNSPFYQALQKRRGEPTVSIQPYPNITQTPQGMLPEDMISLYALGFRDSLMRISPHLGSRGIPVFENMMKTPVVEPAPAPKPAPAPAPNKPAPAPAPKPEPPKFEPKELEYNEAIALFKKYGIPIIRGFYRDMDTSKPHSTLAEFDWAMSTGNIKRARELFEFMFGRNPDYMTPAEQATIIEFRNRWREKFLRMEMEQLRKELAGR